MNETDDRSIISLNWAVMPWSRDQRTMGQMTGKVG